MDLPILRRAYLKPRGLMSVARRSARLWRELRKRRPVLVYLSTSATAPAAPIARMLSIPTVAHIHEALGSRSGRIVSLLLRPSRHLLCVSEYTKRALPTSLQSRATVVHNGISDPSVPKAPETASPPAAIEFVIASRWNRWKGHSELLRAWGMVERSDVRLSIYGGPPLSGDSVDVRALAASLPNSNTVTVCGESDRVLEAIAFAHCVLVPSAQPDPFPTVALEAASLGIAVAASDVGGLPEIVEADATGVLLPPASDVDWSNFIEHVTSETLTRMGAAARARYEAEFTLEHFRIRVAAALRPHLLELERGGDAT